jgi:hypothetical protein
MIIVHARIPSNRLKYLPRLKIYLISDKCKIPEVYNLSLVDGVSTAQEVFS